jgi:hypothetical protein
MRDDEDSPVEDGTRLGVLSRHYSETLELVRAAVDKRDRLFVYILVVIFLLLLYMSAPTVVSDLLNTFISSHAGSSNSPASLRLINVSFIGTVLSLGLLSLAHTYFQTVLHVERQYAYVYQLEDLLSVHFDEKAVIREGKHYLAHKRLFSKWTGFIFWFLFPLLFLVFNLTWLVFLFTRSQTPAIYLVVDSLVSLSTLTSLGFFLLALFKKK